jgi:hypothetical protein
MDSRSAYEVSTGGALREVSVFSRFATHLNVTWAFCPVLQAFIKHMKRFGNDGTYLQAIQSLQYVCFTVLYPCRRQRCHQRPYGREWSLAVASGKLTPIGVTADIDPALCS